MNGSKTILKEPLLEPGSDYELLRRSGLQYIERLGSNQWTDYNTHDPGITILEALCFALTELGYRAGFNIKDLLAFRPQEQADYHRQAFYTAREILTMNPWTPSDYRKLLIDLPGVRNAWVECLPGGCDDLSLCVDCKNSKLVYKLSEAPCEHEEVMIKGLYEVLVQFDDESSTGDLNSGRIKSTIPFFNSGELYHASFELRLPSWYEISQQMDKYKLFASETSSIESITVLFISGNKHDDHDIPAPEFTKALKRPLFATIGIVYRTSEGGSPLELQFQDVPIRAWFHSDSERRLMQFSDIVEFLQDSGTGGVFPMYLQKLQRASEIIDEAHARLHAHRNLCEDFCSVSAIETEDIAVCADIELDIDADIERVLANCYFLIDQYFSPQIKFFSLQELLGTGKPIEEIFEGPALDHGFIEEEQLDSTNLRKHLYVSDIINLLVDLPGVKSVRDFRLVRYDRDGFISETASWTLQVKEHHQARLYLEGSKLLVYKNGLPFLPNRQELSDTLEVIRGQNSQPQYTVTENDLPVPTGTWFNLSKYNPVQYLLPLTYGVSESGLPLTASVERRAQASQLSAYLLFFDQLIVNFLSQLSNLKELFAVDHSVTSSIFSRVIQERDLPGVTTLYEQFDSQTLEDITRDYQHFPDRRNRFLDHMLGRFAEQFNDYALMLYANGDVKPMQAARLLAEEFPFLNGSAFSRPYQNHAIEDDKRRAQQMLISDKIAFLKDVPFITSNRARAFNYKLEGQGCATSNIAGLKQRIMRVLGIGEFESYFVLLEEKDERLRTIGYRWYLRNAGGGFYLFASELYETLLEDNAALSLAVAIDDFRTWILDASHFEIVSTGSYFELNFKDDTGNVIATAGKEFTQQQAEAERDEIISFARTIFEEEKIYIVEHLLLRPRNYSIGRFQLYEEHDEDERYYERRWRLIDEHGKIYLSSSTRYYDPDFDTAQHKAMLEILEVCKRITNRASYTIHKEIKWTLNLVDETGEVIATRKHAYDEESEAEEAREQLIEFATSLGLDRYQLHPGVLPADILVSGDPLLPICASPGCTDCHEHDPYSFRFSVILSGESGILNSSMEFRRFAEQTIRLESPAHLGVKICWVSNEQLEEFESVYCAWINELSKKVPDAFQLFTLFKAFYEVFVNLKSVYPPARLHDCIDGNEDNRTFLDQTII